MGPKLKQLPPNTTEAPKNSSSDESSENLIDFTQQKREELRKTASRKLMDVRKQEQGPNHEPQSEANWLAKKIKFILKNLDDWERLSQYYASYEGTSQPETGKFRTDKNDLPTDKELTAKVDACVVPEKDATSVSDTCTELTRELQGDKQPTTVEQVIDQTSRNDDNQNTAFEKYSGSLVFQSTCSGGSTGGIACVGYQQTLQQVLNQTYEHALLEPSSHDNLITTEQSISINLSEKSTNPCHIQTTQQVAGWQTEWDQHITADQVKYRLFPGRKTYHDHFQRDSGTCLSEESQETYLEQSMNDPVGSKLYSWSGRSSPEESQVFDITQVDREKLRKLLKFLSREEWAWQYFDGKDAFYISLKNLTEEKAIQKLKDAGFWKFPYLPIRFIEPYNAAFDQTATEPEHKLVILADPTQLEGGYAQVRPSSNLLSQRKRALYSGTVRLAQVGAEAPSRGLTVAHLHDGCQDASAFVCYDITRHIPDVYRIGEGDSQAMNVELDAVNMPNRPEVWTTDMTAFIDIDQSTCKTNNELRMRDAANVAWRCRPNLLERDEAVIRGASVLFRDQAGQWKKGLIENATYSDRGHNLFNTLTIVRNDGVDEAISSPGDSGALVALAPPVGLPEQQNQERVLHVIGILLGIYRCIDPNVDMNRYMTVSNRLYDAWYRQCPRKEYVFAADRHVNIDVAAGRVIPNNAPQRNRVPVANIHFLRRAIDFMQRILPSHRSLFLRVLIYLAAGWVI